MWIISGWDGPNCHGTQQWVYTGTDPVSCISPGLAAASVTIWGTFRYFQDDTCVVPGLLDVEVCTSTYCCLNGEVRSFFGGALGSGAA